MSDAEQREEAVFEAARQRQGDERAAYLDETCAGDPALRERVEGLLGALERAGALLDEPVVTRESTSPTAVLPPTAQAGDHVGPYKLLQQIGEGGCGVVYMAEQVQPVKRRVALKILKLGMDTKQVIARFEAERQALALMEHSNIAKVLDAGTTNAGRPYFVMELVRGIKLTDFCDENQLPMRQRLELFIQVCQAVQHAHQKGIIHRDLKPSNILVTVNDGMPLPKVIDFGIAKATAGQTLTDKTLFTAFEQFIGTPAYMSPEQAVMTSLDIDTRSDIYSLGVLLYELLTGKTPFDTKDLLQAGFDEMRRTIREKEPARPSTRLSTMVVGELTTMAKRRHVEAPKLIQLVRGDLDWIVMKCLEKDRARRYASANGLAADLQRHLANEPVVACPPSATYRLHKLVRRNRGVFAAASVVILTLAGGVVLSTWQAVRARQAEERAEANVYSADMWLAQRSGQDGNLGLAMDLLNKHRPQRGVPDRRDWEWRYLWQLCRGDELFSLGSQSGYVGMAAWFPDGNRAVAASVFGQGEVGEVRIWDVAARKVLALPSPDDSVGSVALSPDGQLLAFGTFRQGVILWDVAQSREVARLPVQQSFRSGFGLTFAPEGRMLAAGDQHGEITLWQVDTNGPVHARPRRFNGHRRGISVLAFSPDGKLLVSGSWDRTIKLWDVASAKVTGTFTNHAWEVQTLALSPDGHTIASGGWDRAIRIWDSRTLIQSHLLTNHAVWISSLTFSRDGQTLVSAGADQTIRLWDTATWQERALLRGHRDEVNAAVLSPDESRLLSGAKDGVLKVWNRERPPRPIDHLKRPPDLALAGVAVDGSAILVFHTNDTISLWNAENLGQISRQPLLEPRTNIGTIALRNKDGRMAVGTRDGWLKLLDATTGQQIAKASAGVGPLSALAFSPDGSLLAAGGIGKQIVIFATTPLEPRFELPRSLTNAVATMVFDPDGKQLAAGTAAGVVDYWNLSARQPATWNMRSALTRLAFSRDGGMLIAAAEDARLRVWNLAARRDSFLGRTLNSFTSLALTTDGRRLAAGTHEGVIRMYDLQTWREILTLPGHSGAVSALAFHSDSDRLISRGNDGFRVWRAPAWREIESAERNEN
jgi:WD40 repeat protein/serine/threonine protein kinase